MNDDFYDSEYEQEDDEFLPPSKSQIKREMLALQELGRKLTLLNSTQLAQVPLSDKIRQEIANYLKLKANEAKRRQLQFIGKIMRTEDSEAIEQCLNQFDASSREYAQNLHQLENWRERLLSEEKDVVTEFVEEFPGTDIQALRQLIRNAKKDREKQKNTGNYKKLFRFIKDAQEMQ